MIQELLSIADEIDALLTKLAFGGSFTGQFLPSPYDDHFRSLLREANTIIDHDSGRPNGLSSMGNSNLKSFKSVPLKRDVEEASRMIRSAARASKRTSIPSKSIEEMPTLYVDPSRIAALQTLQGGKWDFTRLVELCRELNVASANRCHMSIAMLLRTILNHVPPILGFDTFAQVASNYGGRSSAKSFKGNMQRLQGSLRNIADMHLHSPIRAAEDVPTAVQIDFAADLDVLLGEVIRVCRDERRN